MLTLMKVIASSIPWVSLESILQKAGSLMHIIIKTNNSHLIDFSIHLTQSVLVECKMMH